MSCSRPRPTRIVVTLAALGSLAACVTTAPAREGERSVEYEMAVQRACEVAIWAMPTVSIHDIELSIQRDLGGEFGDVAYFTKPMTSRHGARAQLSFTRISGTTTPPTWSLPGTN